MKENLEKCVNSDSRRKKVEEEKRREEEEAKRQLAAERERLRISLGKKMENNIFGGFSAKSYIHQMAYLKKKKILLENDEFLSLSALL